MKYFLVPQINWTPKSESVKTIAKRLNIGLDTLAFVDDNPFELNQVGMAVPEVSCIDVRNVDSILNDERFQGSQTADAQNRRRYYQEAIGREEKQADFGDDYNEIPAILRDSTGSAELPPGGLRPRSGVDAANKSAELLRPERTIAINSVQF